MQSRAARRSAASGGPPPTMTWGKAVPVLAVSLVFDALRAFFQLFWFIGPAILGAYCTSKVNEYVGMLWGLTPAACGALAVGAGKLGSPVFIAIGTIMAIAVGLLGWLTIGLIILLTNARVIKDNGLWFVGSLAVSEVPLIGAIPAFTATMIRLYRAQIKKEREMFKKYQREQAAIAAKERAERLAEVEQQILLEQAAAQASEEIPDKWQIAA